MLNTYPCSTKQSELLSSEKSPEHPIPKHTHIYYIKAKVYSRWATEKDRKAKSRKKNLYFDVCIIIF